MRILRKSNTFILGEIKQNASLWDNRKVFLGAGLLLNTTPRAREWARAALDGASCANCC